MTGQLHEAFLRKDLIEQGVRDEEIKRALREGQLIRLHYGAYAQSPAPGLEKLDRYWRRIAACARRSPDLVVSHLSAAVLWGAPIWAADLSIVHLVRAGRGGYRRASDRVVHNAKAADLTCSEIAGCQVTSPARTLVDVAATESLETAVVIGDWMVRQELVGPAAVTEVVDRYRHRGRPAALRALQIVDGRAESPGESVVRCRLRRIGLSSLDLQIEVRDQTGTFVARCDFGLVDEGVLGEYDGRQKYGGADGSADLTVVLAEKRREDLIRGCGAIVVRMDARDLGRIEAFRRRFAQARELGRRARAADLITGTLTAATPRPALLPEYATPVPGSVDRPARGAG